MAGKAPVPPKSSAKPKRPAKPRLPAKPKRPANLPYGRWLGDLEPLSMVERQLVEHCARGAPLTLGNERPEKALAGNKIRAGIIRFLLLGGDDWNPIHEEGVIVIGAWIEGVLSLHQAHCSIRLAAFKCMFDSDLIMAEAAIPGLLLSGSTIPALIADGIKVSGDIVLDDDFTATGEVRLLGAKIGGLLSCIGGRFSNKQNDALSADGIEVTGGIFLRGNFDATGAVRLRGAQIGGDLECGGGTFNNQGDIALNLDGANIQGGLFLRGGSFSGVVSLAAASASTLVDKQACYEKATLILDGFRYDRIVGPTSASERIDWLMRQQKDELGANFAPQPWEHVIKVLREMGHPAEAAEIAMEKQNMLRRTRKIGRRRANPGWRGWSRRIATCWAWLANGVARGLHRFYGWIAGYGHRPSRIVLWLFGVCALCSLAYYGGRYQGLIGPSAPVIQLHPRLAHCGTGGDPGAIHWTSPDCPVPPEYSTFQPFFYSLDVIIPFVDLHQEADWGPVVTNKSGETLWWGRVLRWIMWFEIIFGWIASVMFVGIISRLVDKD